METVEKNGVVYAFIIKNDFKDDGIKFITPPEYSQQLAYMHRPKDYQINAHFHNEVSRTVHITQEVLIIKKGKLRVDFYNKNKQYFVSHILTDGDIILLATGGHGFKMLEPTEIIEVKQGPYAGDLDKTLFQSVSDENVILQK